MVTIPEAPDPACTAPIDFCDDEDLFIRLDEAYREQPADCTYRPDLPPAEERGDSFVPLDLGSQRVPHINTLPLSALSLFQLFIPEFLVQRWVDYSNAEDPSLKVCIAAAAAAAAAAAEAPQPASNNALTNASPCYII